MKATRDAFGEVLVEIGQENNRLICLSADLQDSTKAIEFEKIFPERFFNIGIAEQDLIGIASGFAGEKYIPVVSSFASFLTTRPYDQIRILVAYNNLNVKIVATHSGLTVGADGATAQALEDIAVMRVLPNVKVFQPCDFYETKAILRKAINLDGPVYIRLAREKYPDIYDENKVFEPGKSDILAEGRDGTIIATGFMVSKALEVQRRFQEIGINLRVINLSSIKPLDKELILESAKLTNKMITIEEHQVAGGMGSAIAEFLSQEYPIKIKIIGVEDSFGQSGTPQELLKKYGLDVDSIYIKIKEFLFPSSEDLTND